MKRMVYEEIHFHPKFQVHNFQQKCNNSFFTAINFKIQTRLDGVYPLNDGVYSLIIWLLATSITLALVSVNGFG